MENVTIAFLGDPETVWCLKGYEDALTYKGYATCRFTEFAELVKEISFGTKFAVLVVYAYGDFYSSLLERYHGKLPPILYWYMPQFDHFPATEEHRIERLHYSSLPSILCERVSAILSSS